MLRDIHKRLAALAEVDNPSEQPSPAEIDALEGRLGLQLPDALRAWFGVMGRYRGEALM